MAQSIKFDSTESRILGHLKSYIHKARDARALLNGPILEIYKNAQIQRFATENNSETGQWKSLNPKYAERKRVKYASFPGGGEKIMVATGKLGRALAGSVADGFRKVVTTKSLVISLSDDQLPYAKYAALEREILNFGNPTIEQIQNAIREYILGGDNG